MFNKIKKKMTGVRLFFIIYTVVVIAIIGMLVHFSQEGSHVPKFENNSAENGLFNFLGSSAKLYDKETVSVTLEDVAGIDEVLDDFKEIAEFLKNREKYTALGAHIPKGVLLAGPPGTGKTLIAKAIAGEADRPFYSISGSEFVEVYVGVGASRVRKMFAEARRNGPAIIFIDEIDAIGAKRTASLQNDERVQTLNQLLTEMDGFTEDTNVIVIAATNRIDTLDPALLRSGRFDRRINVPLPDLKSRHAILKMHAKKVILDEGVDLSQLAKMTSGASGADLANVLNEAALLAARKNLSVIGKGELEEGRNRVLFGSETKTRELSEQEKLSTAYHESGHTIVSNLVEHRMKVEKVTIVPRGFSLGHTEFSLESETHSFWKNEMIDELAVLLGGRAAEEIFLGDVSSGAQNDLERATLIARNMVVKWGMNDRFGLSTYSNLSEETTALVEEEVRKTLDEAYKKAKTVLLGKRSQAELMAKMLVEFETLNSDDIDAIVNDTWDIERKRVAEK